MVIGVVSSAKRLASQPQGLVPINWGSPFAPSIVYAGVGNVGVNIPQNSTDGRNYDFPTVFTTAGLATDPTTTANRSIIAPATKTSDFSILSLIAPQSVTGTQQIVASDDSVAGTRFFQFRSSGSDVQFIRFDSPVTTSFTATVSAALTIGKVACVIASTSGPNVQVWVDGRSGSATITGTPATWSSNGNWFERVVTGTGQEHGSHYSILRVIFNRGLTEPEAQSLTANPWQIFCQTQFRIHTDSTPSPTSRTFFIPRKKVMSSQPAGPAAAIDWGNPITRGLASAYIPTAAQYRSFDLATNTRDLTTTADYLPPYRPGAAGFALDSTDTNYVWSISFEPVALRGYPKTGYAAVTVFSLFESRTTNQFGVIYGGGQDGTYYGRLVVSSDATIAFIAASNNATLHPKSPLVADTLYAATGIQSFTRSYRALYVNGHLAETRTESINNLNNGFIAGSIYNVQLRRIKLYCGYVWVRELSAAEIKSLSDNPWQIFKQDRLSPALAEDGKVYAPFMS